MLDPRVQELANLLVHYSTALAKGDKVLIEASDVPSEVVACIVRTVAAAGALPFVETRDRRVMRELYLHASPEQMRFIGALELERMKAMQAYIGIRGGDNATEFADVPPAKMEIVEREWGKPVHSEQRCTHTRWVILRWHSGAMAQAAGMSTEAFEDFALRACCFPYARMQEAVKPLQERMQRARTIRVKSPGTNLMLEKGEIPAIPCVGKRNIPDGECYTAPIRDRVHGVVSFNARSIYHGKVFDNVVLTFEQGKVVKATSSDTASLNHILDADEGARFLGEFSLGFHPAILHPMGDILFDEKIAGSLHMALGNAYAIADNGNRSQIHWDLVLIQRPEYGGGEIFFDDELIRKDGVFVPEELQGLNPERLGAA